MRIVTTLLCHAHVDMALLCLGSLLTCSAEPLRLRIHDDGTLTDEDRERLAAGLGGPDFVSRAEADERLADFLATRPATHAMRRRNPLGLKLVDAALLAPGSGCCSATRTSCSSGRSPGSGATRGRRSSCATARTRIRCAPGTCCASRACASPVT